jgi:hypothetical protein
MSATGTWQLDIKQPVGNSHAVVELTEDNGTLTGTATIDDNDPAPLYEGTADGNDLSWRVDITKPFKLKILFTVVRDGDTLTGKGKAGRWPASKVTGKRVS